MIRKRTTEGAGYYSDGDPLGCRRMTPEEEQELFSRYRAGDLKARDALVENQLLFAAKEAIRIAPSWMPIDTIISAANWALMKAVARFDHTRGTRFYVYARKFVLGEVNRAWRDTAPVHIPNARPVPDPVTWENIERPPDDCVSLQPPEQPDEIEGRRDMVDVMLALVARSMADGTLTKIERHVLVQRYLRGWTFQAIANRMPRKIGRSGLSRERIRQISAGACLKLKAVMTAHGIDSCDI